MCARGVRNYCSKKCYSEDRLWKRVLGRKHNGRSARLNNYGYVLVWEPEHPMAFRGWYFEHRVVMEKKLGRRLLRSEEVHHINGVKDDNRIENLEILDSLTHKTITARQVKDRREGVENELRAYQAKYGPLSQS